MGFDDTSPPLLAVLRCPECAARDWHADPDASLVSCRACGRRHPVRDGILHVQLQTEHDEVVQERASVPATEGAPELGGWREGFASGMDAASALGQAYLALPYGNGSIPFQEPGYFQNVQRFAPEFDFILKHLPHTGMALDVGADGTWSTARLAARGLTCIALDITNHLVLAHMFQTACPPYALVNVDMHAPVFADEAFDVVTAFNALHHSTRLDALAANIGRMITPGGVLAIVEPYVQNAAQEAEFGAPQSAAGINENVHTIERWHGAFRAAGLQLEVFGLSDSFNAIYRKRDASPSDTANPRDTYYEAALHADPLTASTRAGEWVDFNVTVESRGRAAWASRGPLPVRLSYHISRVTPDGPVMYSFDNHRHLLESFLAPGEPRQFRVPVEIKEPGLFEVEFDLVHEAVNWFKDRGGQTATVEVRVV
jgi:SAM-dependent methyltransferase/uncharacterized protein YbaR (Trm112 family)